MKKIIILLVFSICFLNTTNVFAKVRNDQEFADFFTKYYQHENKKDITQAIKYFLESRKSIPNWIGDRRYVGMIAYTFARLAQINPKLIPKYQKMYDKADDKEKLFLLSIFVVYHDNEVESFLKDRGKKAEADHLRVIDQILANDPLGRDFFIHKPRMLPDLDFLWAEFFVSGDVEVVNYLIDLLASPDVFSSKLLDFMLAADEKSDVEIQKLERVLYQELGLKTDVKKMDIGSLIDLDYTFSRYARTIGSMKEHVSFARAIQSMLNLDSQDIEKMVMKESALLAIQNNVVNHPRLVDILKQQAGIRKGKIVQILKELIQIAPEK